MHEAALRDEQLHVVAEREHLRRRHEQVQLVRVRVRVRVWLGLGLGLGLGSGLTLTWPAAGGSASASGACGARLGSGCASHLRWPPRPSGTKSKREAAEVERSGTSCLR